MRRVALLLMAASALTAGQDRYARLGEFQGQVEVQLSAADSWIPAQRNLPLAESTWVRTGQGGRLEIEFDDGSMWRLGANSQGEISDYTRLSTGQRLTLLSLDRGTAYFTGQPEAKDVVMLVVPGAHMTLKQGSRVRTVALADTSQIAILEGQVRFSSPAAEMDIREGTTARVEPANPARFFLDPDVSAESLDRWSEDRDKQLSAPAAAAHVTARYGLLDLDAAGKWITTPELGLVWKPDVAPDWAPYQKGRWLYFETLGYTWVSDDSWGWLPYHNGRWARANDAGWVWQPSVNNIFHPAEVYWLRGGNFVGWGPLAPGESWTGTGTPQLYPGYATFAGFQANSRIIDPAGFPTPTAEQQKSLVSIAAPPSPAFLVSRLDATRPVLKVGSTRILPSVPGVTMGDTPPAEPSPDAVTRPINDAPPPPAADAGSVNTPPDGVYPAVYPVAVIEVPVVVNPPQHPDYSRSSNRSNNSSSGGSNANSAPATVPPSPPGLVRRPVSPPSPASTPGLATRPQAPQPAPTTPQSASPVNRPPASEPPRPTPTAPSAPRETPRPAPPPPARIEPAKPDPPKGADKKAAMGPAELEVYRQLLQDVEVPKPNYNKVLADLAAWTRRFATTAWETERAYYYVHAYNALGQSEQVLTAAAPLVTAGVARTYDDPQRILQVLVAASSSIQKVARPSRAQLDTGEGAARELLEFLPAYFVPRAKPANVSDAAWQLARLQLETVAKETLQRRFTKLAAR